MLINPRNLYSGGNVALDSTPYMRVAMQQQARKDAIHEASKQYYSKLADHLNTAGILANDLHDPVYGGIQDDIDNWKADTQANMGEILKGGTAQSKSMASLNAIRNEISLAKQKGATVSKVALETFKPNGMRFNSDDVDILHNINRPLKDPLSRKSDGVSLYGMGDLSPNVPELDLLKHNKTLQDGIPFEQDPNDKGIIDNEGKKITYQYGISPDNITRIADKAQSLASIKNTPERKYYMSVLGDHNMGERASKALQTEYDKRVGDGQKVVVDTPEEMARGLALDRFTSMKKPHEVNDVAALNKFKDDQLSKKQAFAASQTRIKEAGKNARTKAFMGGANIRDIYGDISNTPDVEIKTPIGDKVKLKDISTLTPPEMDDLLGKENKYNERPAKPIVIGDKSYVRSTPNGLTDENDIPLDKDATFANTYKRLHQSKEGQAKGKVKAVTSQGATKPMSLAEKMKAAKHQ